MKKRRRGVLRMKSPIRMMGAIGISTFLLAWLQLSSEPGELSTMIVVVAAAVTLTWSVFEAAAFWRSMRWE